jgi:hypothetical protein
VRLAEIDQEKTQYLSDAERRICLDDCEAAEARIDVLTEALRWASEELKDIDHWGATPKRHKEAIAKIDRVLEGP